MVFEQIIDLEQWLFIVLIVLGSILLLFTIWGILYQIKVNKVIKEENHQPLYNPWPLQRNILTAVITTALILIVALLFAEPRTIITKTDLYEYSITNYDAVNQNDQLYIYKDLIENNNDIPGYTLVTDFQGDFEIRYYKSSNPNEQKVDFIITVKLVIENMDDINDTFYMIRTRKNGGNFVGSGGGGSVFKTIIITGTTEETFDMKIDFKFYEQKTDTVNDENVVYSLEYILAIIV